MNAKVDDDDEYAGIIEHLKKFYGEFLSEDEVTSLALIRWDRFKSDREASGPDPKRLKSIGEPREKEDKVH